MLEKQVRKREEAARPFLEEGEQIRATMIGQTPVPPIIYLLIAPLVFVFVIQFKTVVVTDRNIYVLRNKWMRTYAFQDDFHRAPLGSAKVESGPMWMRVDDGPRIWIGPFGPAKRWRDEVVAAAARPQPAGEVTAGAGSEEPQTAA